MKTVVYLAVTRVAATPSNLAAAERISSAFGAALRALVTLQTESLVAASGISTQMLDDWIGEPISPILLSQPDRIAEGIARAVDSRCDIAAIVAPHTPAHLDYLAMLSAALGIPFIANMAAVEQDAIQSFICASRVAQSLAMPRETFCATFQSSIQIHARARTQSSSNDLSARAIARSALFEFMPFDSVDFDLDTANIVFSAGRGIGNDENFKKFSDCARKFNAAIAASRCAVDLGWARNDHQVGQTGKTIAPDIYVAFGISGAIQHMAGIKQAKTLVAINIDADAPIFESSDYGICEDANRIVQYLLER